MIVFSLRREARVSGESASFALLREILEQSGIVVQSESELAAKGSPATAALQRLAVLTSLANANTTDTLLIKLPTAAQLPLALYAVRGFRGRRIFWIDGLLWRPLPPVLMAKVLWGEPLLNVARSVANNPGWLWAVRDRGLELVVASHTQRIELAAWLPRAQIHVIPNGSPESAPPSEPALSEDAGLPGQRPAEDPTSFGYIGHSYLTKGVWDILAAHRILKAQGQAPQWLFALSTLGGEGFQQALIQEGLEPLGHVQKSSFYPRLRALVAPYWTAWGTQSFPNILLEAMQAGVPVITSDLPLSRELFPDHLALFVPPHRPLALAETLLAVQQGQLPLPKPELLRAHFQTHYCPEKIATLWRDLLAPK